MVCRKMYKEPIVYGVQIPGYTIINETLTVLKGLFTLVGYPNKIVSCLHNVGVSRVPVSNHILENINSLQSIESNNYSELRQTKLP